MALELILQFPGPDEVIVSLGGRRSSTLTFRDPLTPKDLDDLRWYVEVYGAHSLGDPDDQEAARVRERLPALGKALFQAVFAPSEARRLFDKFQDEESEARLLTIEAEHAGILALPWELLHDPDTPDETFLFFENPSVSIRRGVAGSTKGRDAFLVEPKDRLHILFVVSRPEGAGFIDPRADPQAVLVALEQQAPGRFTTEFLRPPTLDALVDRLKDRSLPPVDVLHFDGHGAFDREGGLPDRAAKEAPRRAGPAEAVLRNVGAREPDQLPNTGYLLFEAEDGGTDFVSAKRLGANLHRHRVSLVILSACQSAAVGEQKKDEEKKEAAAEVALGSVAARLTATGIPAVLAMTHSVLVPTTRALFGAFYRHLARHEGIGAALDESRRYLYNHPEKYKVPRGTERVPLKLYDWFLPALYQSGEDVPLLQAGASTPAAARPLRSNLPPEPESGFFGRRRELWDLERWFAGETHRITVTGFGGQGKTALAQEAGRWLLRTGLFQAAVFVPYAQYSGRDALAIAVNEIGSVLDRTFQNAAEVEAALRETPALVILDNLESLDSEPLQELLAAAVRWSEAGASRVLCTTRRPDLEHPLYRNEGTRVHRRIPLEGLGSRSRPDDALEWLGELWKLPPDPDWPLPKREALVELFEQVRFHPLSIRVLAQQLKTRRPAELGRRLEELLAGVAPSAAVDEDTPAGLLASIQLSLDRLDAECRKVLPRLGVFQGGAFEDNLLAVTDLGDFGQREHFQNLLAAIERGDPREILAAMGHPDPASATDEQLAIIRADIPRARGALAQQLAELEASAPALDLWPKLRRQLEAAALVETETVPGVRYPYLRFHPTLAPLLRPELDTEERMALEDAHQKRYAGLAEYLYEQDTRNAHHARVIAHRELPNLLHACFASFDAEDPNAGAFATELSMFLRVFSLRQEAEALLARARSVRSVSGSQAWYLAESGRGEQLFEAGRISEAAAVFEDVLANLDDTPTYERAVSLLCLGRCLKVAGCPDLAAIHAREASSILSELEQSEQVTQHWGFALADLGNALADLGEYSEAKQAHTDALEIAQGLGDLRAQAVSLFELGTLALVGGQVREAAEQFQEALLVFQQLHEPRMEAVAWHQLGLAFEMACQWGPAEQHYRESARIKEQIGDLVGAAGTWNQLAMVSQAAGKLQAAEAWYRRAVAVSRALDVPAYLGQFLSNLAGLLWRQSGRLAEARQHAAESLTISETHGASATEIWKTYGLLAEIAAAEASEAFDPGRRAELLAEAADYRRQARITKWAFPGTRHDLRQLAPVILGAVLSVGQPQLLLAYEPVLSHLEQRGFPDLVPAIRRILDGERDEDTLCEPFGWQDGTIVMAILRGLADPSTLEDLLPEGEEGQAYRQALGL